MKKHGFLILGIVFIVLFIGFWLWYAPSGGKLTPEETNRYVAMASKLPAPPEDKPQMLASLRAWCESDDGKPVYMLNLLRDYNQLKKFPGTPDFNGTPTEANKLYEKKVMPFLLKRAAFIAYYGKVSGKSISGSEAEVNNLNFDEVLLVRYPNRRAFVDMLSEPAYAPVVVYKFMGTKINLLPTESIAFLPDMRSILGALLLVIYLGIGWYRSARGKAAE